MTAPATNADLEALLTRIREELDEDELLTLQTLLVEQELEELHTSAHTGEHASDEQDLRRDVQGVSTQASP